MDHINSDDLPNSLKNTLAEDQNPANDDGSPEMNNSEEAKKPYLYLPLANVTRIMREVLPAKAKISHEAKYSMQECVAEFMGLIIGEANDRCRQELRTVVTGEDLIWAMNRLGFDDYVGPLQNYLHRYRLHEGTSHRSFIQPYAGVSQPPAVRDAYGELFPAPGIPPQAPYGS